MIKLNCSLSKPKNSFETKFNFRNLNLISKLNFEFESEIFFFELKKKISQKFRIISYFAKVDQLNSISKKLEFLKNDFNPLF